VDSLGRPLHIHLTAGNIHDVTEAPTLIAAAQVHAPRVIVWREIEEGSVRRRGCW